MSTPLQIGGKYPCNSGWLDRFNDCLYDSSIASCEKIYSVCYPKITPKHSGKYEKKDISIQVENAVNLKKEKVCKEVTQIPQTECEALVTLYSYTNGVKWSHDDNWLTQNPCDWYGISCKNNHVTKIELASNQLAGFIPFDLASLTKLIVLKLNGNESLDGSIPFKFNELEKLQSFYFNTTNLCELTDNISQEWLSNIDDFVSSGKICNSQPILSLAENSQAIQATSASFSFDIKNIGMGSMDWTVSSNVDWLTVDNASGTNDSTITVNYVTNNGDARTGTITIVANDTKNSPQEIEVNQAKTHTRKGMTWKRHETLSTSELEFVGCSGCEPYNGDTYCSAKLPILCIKQENLPNPGLDTDYSHGWTGGYISLTPSIAGSELTGIGDAKLVCEYSLGEGYRMAEFHDGKGGWGYYSYGNVSEDTRFWTYIDDQNANCWGRGVGTEPEANALDRLIEAMDCDKPNNCQHMKPFTNIAGIHNIANDETLSSLWVDYDNDADLDLLIVSNSSVAYDKNKMVYLYQNNGYSFTDVAIELGLTATKAANSISIGDYDNDGDSDLLIGGRLFENDWNNTGKFNFIGIYKSSFVDYDNDGDLDIYGGSWGSPGKLYRNDMGTFNEVDGALGLTNNSKHYRSDNWADYDNDGDMDVLIVNGRSEAVTFYRNDFNTTGRFTDITNNAGLANAGKTGYTDTAAWGDYDNDGDLDFYISAEHGAGNRIYRNDNNVFTDVTAELGTSFYDGSHGSWGDYDNDGDLDLYMVTVRNDNRLYRNELTEGNGFVETGYMASDAKYVKWGGSWGDYDNDGDLDYIVTGGGSDEL